VGHVRWHARPLLSRLRGGRPPPPSGPLVPVLLSRLRGGRLEPANEARPAGPPQPPARRPTQGEGAQLYPLVSSAACAAADNGIVVYLNGVHSSAACAAADAQGRRSRQRLISSAACAAADGRRPSGLALICSSAACAAADFSPFWPA